MTKAKARQRAKANAAEKAAKREDGTDRSLQQVRRGQFNSGPGSIKSPRMAANIKALPGVRRGGARSR
jgi:hypothetical protein